MERIAEVYARALFEAAQGRGVLDAVRDQLAAFVDALHANRNLMIFFFSPYFSAQEKKDGLHRAVSDADETFMQFLEVLLESHRMPAIFAIKDRYERLWREEMKLLSVEVTSAVGLDSQTRGKPRRPDRSADRSRGRALQPRGPRDPRRDRPSRRQLRARRLD